MIVESTLHREVALMLGVGAHSNPSTQKDERRELQGPGQTALYQVKVCFTVLSHHGDEMVMLFQFLPS